MPGNPGVTSDQMNENRPIQCFMRIDGVKGPSVIGKGLTAVKNIFAVKEFSVEGFKDINVGGGGLLSPAATTIRHIMVVIPFPKMLPALQSAAFAGTVFKKVTLQVNGDSMKTNQEFFKVDITNARLALVTTNYQPGIDGGTDHKDIYGACVDSQTDRDLFFARAAEYPNQNVPSYVILKFAFDAVALEFIVREDAGKKKGKMHATYNVSLNVASK